VTWWQGAALLLRYTAPRRAACPVIGKKTRLRDDALVKWWECVLAGVAVALVLELLFKVLHG
jgi:hypothetical protein